jgi:AcrR family transcriptional regulator
MLTSNHKAVQRRIILSTRERLLDRAITLFALEGYDRVTVNEVVAAAKVTKGAFYHYFESKDDLLAEIHTSYVEYAHERFKAICETDESADLTLTRLITELFDQIEQYRSQVVVLWDSRRSLPPSTAAVVEHKKTEIRHFFKSTIERGQASGIFASRHNSSIAALGVFGMGMWAYHWYSTDGELAVEDIAREFSDIVLGGLRVGSL